MQIDFHHTVTYVVARLAGYGHLPAQVIAHCAQYVDDATNCGSIAFDNGAMYYRMSSAHKALDYSNLNELANQLVWIPFHFLPGAGGSGAAQHTGERFIDDIICRPLSQVAKDMVRACFDSRNKPYGLHRLGVTMHVFADTWAHQGFAGVTHKINIVRDVRDEHGKADEALHDRLKECFGDVFDRTAGKFVGDVMPIGHGAALSYPDRPYLRWRYKNGNGTLVERDNPTEFLQAADEMCKVLQCFRAEDLDADPPGLPDQAKATIDHMLRTITDLDGRKRHKKWLTAISRGELGFPPVKLRYVAKGRSSWKHQALGTLRHKDKRKEKYVYHHSFLESDWKLFHDALMAHRFSIIHEILPSYGICAA